MSEGAIIKARAVLNYWNPVLTSYLVNSTDTVVLKAFYWERNSGFLQWSLEVFITLFQYVAFVWIYLIHKFLI